MSSPYNGNPGNESRANAIGITSSTNATPIIVTTASAHGLLEGDRVSIIKHATNTAANGAWYASVVTPTTIALYADWSAGAVASPSVGNGVGGATGTAKYLGLMPRVTLPDDASELTSVAPINVGLEDAKDTQAYLAERTGAYRLIVDDIFGNLPNATPFALWALAYQAGNGAWATMDDLITKAGSSTYDVLNGDLIEAELLTSGQATGTVGTDDVALRLGIATYDYGASAPANAGSAVGGGGAILYGFAESGATHLAPVHIMGRWQVTATRGQQLAIYTMAYGRSSSAFFSLAGDWIVRVRIWRAN